MAETKNYIELNGKRYDVVTGALLPKTDSDHKEVAAKVKAATTAASHSSAAPAHGKTLDGFRHPVKKLSHAVKPAEKPAAKAPAVSHTAKSATPATHEPTTAKPAAKQVMDIRRAPAKHITHRQPEHSKTLMRQAVKRPAPGLKRTLKTQTRTDILAKVPAQQLAPKMSIQQIDEKRLRRAEHVNKSQLISRFSMPPVAVERHPAAVKQSAEVRQLISQHPADVKPVYAASPAAVRDAQSSMDIFERALLRANSHKETAIDPKKLARTHKKRSKNLRRFISSGAIAMSVLLIGGFIALQNTANLEMALAAQRSGLHATLPEHKPAGFAAGKFSYGAGFVAVDFHNNASGANFKLTQKASSWNSVALLNEYVSNAAGESYQTLTSGGRTIYTYGNNNATWVDGGIWYNVTSNGSLTTNQLIDIAASM